MMSTKADAMQGAGGTGVGAETGGRRERLAALGGVLGAIAASSCCIVPLILVSVGISGAWMLHLTALSPYKPIFVAITVGFLAWGHYLVYLKPKRAYATGAACARPLPGALVQVALWAATALVALSLAWSWLAPYIAPWLLGLR